MLLHAGVADSRCWHEVAPLIDGATYTYDRRGFGATPPSAEPFTHVEDLFAVLERVGPEPAWLVGNSQGGRIALDAALTQPQRVAGLVLISPAVSGAPDAEELDADTARLDREIEAAEERGDLDAVNRLETRLWLDGPAGPEGRVGGPARELALAMNAIALSHELPGDAGAAHIDAFSRLEELSVPTTVAWGQLEIPALMDEYAEVASRIPDARRASLPDVAHLPMLERPGEVAALVNEAVPG